jgi:hypothetical protein
MFRQLLDFVLPGNKARFRPEDILRSLLVAYDRLPKYLTCFLYVRMRFLVTFCALAGWLNLPGTGYWNITWPT